tara:strand:- start:3578 stop:3955 length:378 start_codon:yes stop_codon:yes gene_type:complete
MADLGLKALNEADSLNPIKNLWRNVLIVAIEDAIRITKLIKKFPHFYDSRRYHSLDYVKLPNRDFNRVCEYAELDHNLTRKKIITYLERIKNEETDLPKMSREWVLANEKKSGKPEYRDSAMYIM